MKYRNLLLLLIIAIGCLMSCGRKSFVEFKLKAEKTGKDCSQQQSAFRMNSNFGGERYEFEKCLTAGFSTASATTERRGDTVVFHFNEPANAKPSEVFQLTLDIDSYPAYHFLTIGEDTYTITAAAK